MKGKLSIAARSMVKVNDRRAIKF